MSPQAFSSSFVVGAALLALWVVRRADDRGPRSFWTVIGHLVLANVLSSLLLQLTPWAMPVVGPVGALMLIALPALVYFFVAAAWLLLFLQRLLRPTG
jgi:O-antigen/teichoic acid export membrane protein